MDEVEAILNRIEADLIDDRSKIDNILVKLDTLTSRIDRLYERVPRLEVRLTDAVHDGMIEVSQPLTEMVDKFKGKVTIVPEKKKKFNPFGLLNRTKVKK